jgi:hypothetical protein
LRQFENRVLRTLGEETIRKRRKLHNEELHILFSYSNIRTIKFRIRRKWWGRHVAHMG